MSKEVAALIGSGTVLYTYGILDPTVRGFQSGAEGVRVGTQVIIANPEDLLAVDAFAASGISVSTVATEIIGPYNNPLPRSRSIIVENTGNADVYLSHKASFTTQDAFELSPEGTAGRSSRVELPLLHNVSMYAKTASGSTTVRLLIF